MQRHTITLTALAALLLLSGSPAWAGLSSLPQGESAPLEIETAEEHIYMPGDMDMPVPDGWQGVEPIYDI
jgi:hypothetical protein